MPLFGRRKRKELSRAEEDSGLDVTSGRGEGEGDGGELVDLGGGLGLTLGRGAPDAPPVENGNDRRLPGGQSRDAGEEPSWPPPNPDSSGVKPIDASGPGSMPLFGGLKALVERPSDENLPPPDDQVATGPAVADTQAASLPPLSTVPLTPSSMPPTPQQMVPASTTADAPAVPAPPVAPVNPYRPVRVWPGVGGWGSGFVVQPSPSRNVICSVTGGGIHPVAQRIAELTGATAVDGFGSTIRVEQMACAVIDCGGTARIGVYPMKGVLTIDIHTKGPSGPLAQFITEDNFVSGVTADDVTLDDAGAVD